MMESNEKEISVKPKTQKDLFKYFRSLKKRLNLKTTSIRYHNKNNSGGNFGYYLNDGLSNFVVVHGNYNNNNALYAKMNLDFGYKGFQKINLDELNQALETFFLNKQTKTNI